MIPKIIHFIFFGFTKFEYIHYLAVKSALKVHQGYHIKLHCANQPKNNPLWDEISDKVELVYCEPPTHFNGVELTSFQYKADIRRLEILINEGGIYMDIDVISLKPFGDLLDNECVIGIESGTDNLETAESISNAVILTKPNHPFMIDWLYETGNNLVDKHWAYHGVNLPVEILKKKHYDVKLQPRESFMPFGWRDMWIFGSDMSNMEKLKNSYTIHMWETIWQSELEKLNDKYFILNLSLLSNLCQDYYKRNIMPTSSESGKQWIEHQLKHIAKRCNVKKILDIGAGEGTYWNKYRSLFSANWTAIEVWKDYIDKFELESKYDIVINQDARLIEYHTDTKYDIVFAGDVLEHMTKEEAMSLVDKLLENGKCVIVSIPIIHMPQGEWEGNPYEEHIKDDWSDQEFRETFGVHIFKASVNNEIGTYILTKDKQFVEEYSKLKIAVYTICKNEEHFVQRWLDSNKDADLRLVCDTGSTDNTAELLKQGGVTVVPIKVLPWRFDTARNTALNLLPADIDICIWQDLDEALFPLWREELEQHWEPDATIANHKYRNNDKPWQWHSKIHARHNCYWTGAVHETLHWNIPEKELWLHNVFLDEQQDIGKDRRGYLNLLEKKVKEGDNNWRTYYFLANEYQSSNDLDKAIETRIKSYEACKDGDIISSYIAKNIAINYGYQDKNRELEQWYETALKHSGERETLFSFVEYLFRISDWDRCYLYAKKCIEMNAKRDGFTYDPSAWGYKIFDYGALAAYNIGLYQTAVSWGEEAVKLNPTDERLKLNLEFYDNKSPLPFPDTIEIETNSACNRTCNACLRNSHPDREKVESWFSDSYMPMEKIKLIFDQAKHMGFKEYLGLSHFNEPLTDPRLVDIIKLARNYPFKQIFFHSNGDLLTEELAAQLDGLVDWIVFSVYAASPAKEKREEQIKSWFKYTDIRFTPGILGLTHHGPDDDMEGVIESVKNLHCFEPRLRFIINHKGDMEFCCDDLGGNFGLGSITEDTTIHDLWHNTRFQRMMKQLGKPGGRIGLPYCESCPRPTERIIQPKNINVVKIYEKS